MTITIGWRLLPAAITLAVLFGVVKENRPQGDFDFGFPILVLGGGFLVAAAWAIYFGVRLLCQ